MVVSQSAESPAERLLSSAAGVWLAVNFHLFGFAPAGWHLAIVAVHLIAVWLVFEIARELSATRWTPLIAATLFGVIPIHAQAVVWPTAIPLPMSAAFELAALLCFIRLRHRESKILPKLPAPLFYALALLSHESAVAFPAIVAAYVLIAPLDQTASENSSNASAASWRERIARAAVATIPFLIELLVYLAIRIWVLGFVSRVNITNQMTRAEALLTMPGVIGSYAMLLIAPWRAGPSHPVEMVSTIGSREFFLPLFALAGLIGSTVMALWNDRHRKLYLFCAIWMLVALAPMLNLRAFSPLAMVEDRYLYLTSAAWCIALGELAVSILSGLAANELPLAIGAVALAAVYAGILFHAESFWHDEVALFSTCAEMSPRSNLCHDRLGLALKRRGDLTGAERQFMIAQEIKPDDGANLYNLGLLRAQMGRTGEAVNDMRRALAMLPDAPPGAFVELAKTADLAGDDHERDAAMTQAATLPGGAAAVEIGKAELMIQHHDPLGTENFLKAALARHPDSADEWTLLGNAFAQEGRPSDAIEAYRKSLSLRPDPNLDQLVASMLGQIGSASTGGH